MLLRRGVCSAAAAVYAAAVGGRSWAAPTAAAAAACALQQHNSSFSSAGWLPERHSTTILCIRRGPEVVIIGDGQATQGDFVVKPNVRKVRRIGASAVGGFAGVAVDGLALLERLESQLEEHPGQLARAAVELAKMWRQDKMMRELDASLVVADSATTLWLMGNGDVLEAAPGGSSSLSGGGGSSGADGADTSSSTSSSSSSVMAIGSGADFAEAAARALLQLQDDLMLQQQHAGAQGAGGDASSSSSGGGGASQQHPQHPQQQQQPLVPDPQAVLGMSLMQVAQAAMRIAAASCIYTNSNFTWHHIQPDGTIVSGDSSRSSSSSSSGDRGGGDGGGGSGDSGGGGGQS